jgi:cyanophycinase
MAILKRFVELSGGADARIVVITAASTVAEHMWEMYDKAFGELGVRSHVHLHLRSRQDANNEEHIRDVVDATGIFMTGGDQKRLLAIIGGTALDAEMHAALKLRGACIGGTSAGASAMSGHMLARAASSCMPEKGSVSLGAGLGFLHKVVVDQHFSERQRLSRLLSVVAQNPYLQGIGIDEDTALVVERGIGIEVLGEGAVTIVDGRTMDTNIAEIADRETPELIDVRLHLLPSGSKYQLPRTTAAARSAIRCAAARVFGKCNETEPDLMRITRTTLPARPQPVCRDPLPDGCLDPPAPPNPAWPDSARACWRCCRAFRRKLRRACRPASAAHDALEPVRDGAAAPGRRARRLQPDAGARCRQAGKLRIVCGYTHRTGRGAALDTARIG